MAESIFGEKSAKYRGKLQTLFTFGLPAWYTHGQVNILRYIYRVGRKTFEDTTGDGKHRGRARKECLRLKIENIESYLNQHRTVDESRTKRVDFTEDGRVPYKPICFGATFVDHPLPLPDGSAAGNRVHPSHAGCIDGCFARFGQYRAGSVQWSQMNRFALTKLGTSREGEISPVARQELEGWMPAPYQGKRMAFRDILLAELLRRPVDVMRVHDSGDFYSAQYFKDWLWAVTQANKRKRIPLVFMYTKAVLMVKSLMASSTVPSNFRVAFSEGGAEDHLIDRARDRHSRIFISYEQMARQGYVNAHFDDAACFGKNTMKIGLYCHGGGRPFTTDPSFKGQVVTTRPPESISYDDFYVLVKKGILKEALVPNRRTIPLILAHSPKFIDLVRRGVFGKERQQAAKRAASNPPADVSPIFPGAVPIAPPDDR